jgi:hypothetical protein
MTREDVMVYSAMVAAFSLLAAGFLKDVGFGGTAFAFAVIAMTAMITGLMGFLHTPNQGYDTRSGHGG